MFRWLRNRKRVRRSSDSLRQAVRRRPFFERLEDRTLLSITITDFRPPQAVEGHPVTGVVASFSNSDLTDTASDHRALIDWGDGVTSAGTVMERGGGAFDVVVTLLNAHTYALEGHYVFVVSVEDLSPSGGMDSPSPPPGSGTDGGGSSSGSGFASQTGEALVADAPLSAQGMTITPRESVAFNGTVATFTDANPFGQASHFAAEIDWGDGVTSAGTVAAISEGFAVSGTHTYTSAGPYVVTVTIRDVINPADPAIVNSTATARTDADVESVPPLFAAGVAITATESVAFTGAVATFSDQDNPGGDVSRYTVQIAWGDGATSGGTVVATQTGFEIRGTHTYDAQGLYGVTVDIFTGGTSPEDTAHSVADVAPSPLAAEGVEVRVRPGTVADQVITATFTDAPPEAVGNYTALIDWGDGTPQTAGTIAFADGTFTVTGSHTYARPGKYTVRTTIHDEGGMTVAVTAPSLIGSIHERFVAQAYRDLLAREVDAPSLDSWTDVLDRGVITRGQFVLLVVTSREYRTKLVNSLYEQLLGRPADPGGLEAFVNFLDAGGRIEQVQALLLASDEYFNRAGGTNDAFLSGLYQDVLGRPIDPVGRQFFLGVLTLGVSRYTIALAIVTSPEGQARVVRGYYEAFVRRPADPGGLAFYVQALQRGARREAVIADIVGSEEYLGLVS